MIEETLSDYIRGTPINRNLNVIYVKDIKAFIRKIKREFKMHPYKNKDYIIDSLIGKELIE